MLKSLHAFSSFSVNSLEKAKEFYGQTLGLDVLEEKGMGLKLNLFKNQEVFIYEKPNHEPATFTILNFVVENIEETVSVLLRMGIKFEIYSNDQIKTDSRGIARDNQGPAIAWFKDPAGNFLSLIEDNKK